DGIRDRTVTGVQTCALPILPRAANVHVCASAPHSELLKQAAVVVTHAGHGTVIRALAAGVPLVCMPMGRDQNENAARVVFRGAEIGRASCRERGEVRGGCVW